jgi:hypothetical protein
MERIIVHHELLKEVLLSSSEGNESVSFVVIATTSARITLGITAHTRIPPLRPGTKNTRLGARARLSTWLRTAVASYATVLLLAMLATHL